MTSLIEKDSLIVADYKNSFWFNDYTDSRWDRVSYEKIHPVSGRFI